MPIDKNLMIVIRAEIQDALDKISKTVGVNFTLRNGTYTPETLSFKLTGAIIDKKTGKSINEEEQDFTKYATRYGLDPSDLHKTIVLNDEKYIISGLTTRSRKYTILVTNVKTKKPYKMTPAMVKVGLTAFTQQNTPQS